MDISKLQNLADKNEVRIDDYKGHKSNPPYYYVSLRNAFDFYFKTFRTINESYNFYIVDTSSDNKKNLYYLERQFLDEENTVLSLVFFEHFFELFLKDLLRKSNIRLTQTEKRGFKSKTTWELIEKIKLKSFKSINPTKGKGVHQIPLRETLNRFYNLIEYSKDPNKKSNQVVKKFVKTIKPFNFLDSSDYKTTLEFVNWYRDRILHSGIRLPRLRFFDFIVTQRLIPIIKNIFKSDSRIPVDWLYFTKTLTGIEILDEMIKTNFNNRNLRTEKSIKETIKNLLYIGHLKELGRANMNMNIAIRNNFAPYEYNYRDPKGRGLRIAFIEKSKHSNAKIILKCPCCDEKSLVLYEERITDIFNIGEKVVIQWVKCYTCDYHIRNNVLDLHFFNEKFEKFFDY